MAKSVLACRVSAGGDIGYNAQPVAKMATAIMHGGGEQNHAWGRGALSDLFPYLAAHKPSHLLQESSGCDSLGWFLY